MRLAFIAQFDRVSTRLSIEDISMTHNWVCALLFVSLTGRANEGLHLTLPLPQSWQTPAWLPMHGSQRDRPCSTRKLDKSAASLRLKVMISYWSKFSLPPIPRIILDNDALCLFSSTVALPGCGTSMLWPYVALYGCSVMADKPVICNMAARSR